MRRVTARFAGIHLARPRGALRTLVAMTGVVLGGAAVAHHSINGMYDNARQRTFEARVAEFQFVNPHPYVVVTGDPDATGAEQRYKFEMDNRHELVDIGITAATFKAGDRVVVTGSVNRTDALSFYLWRLDRATDGLHYEQIGFDPHISYVRPK
ncbi:MAG: DUF6152 family protein [Gammaproteobacteria bacterium]